MSDAVMLPVVDCWNGIGVKGDRSCPKLKDVIHCHNCAVFADAARAFLDRPVPAGYSSEVTASFANAAVSQRVEAISALVFEVGTQLLAIDTKAVVEVTSTRRVHRVGHRSGRIFSGIVNIHGQLELCCSLSGLLHIDTLTSDSSKPTARMLLVEHQGLRWSFEVSAVLGVQRFESEQISAVPATSQQDGVAFMQHVLSLGERRVGRLDLEKAFRALESSLR